MNERKYRDTWLRLQKKYEKISFRTFISSLRDSANRVPWDNMDERNYIALLELNINQNEIERAYFNTYLRIGKMHGNLIGKGINKDIKNFLPDSFATIYESLLRFFIRDSLGLRITTVRDSLVKYLIGEIERGISENLTIRQISTNMQKLVNSRSFYRWQALRIARTETTSAANFGATIAGETSGIVLEKEWISAQDPRTRRRPKSDYDHLEMNGVKVGQNEKFNVDGDIVDYPGDPKGRAGNTINCRCTVALVPKRDSNGRLVLLSGG